MMAVGWMAFLGSWLMNALFYKVHPSAVDCSVNGVREKLFIHVQGKKRFLWGYRDSKGINTVSTYNLYLKIKLLSFHFVNLDEAGEVLKMKAEDKKKEDNSYAREEETTFNNTEVSCCVFLLNENVP